MRWLGVLATALAACGGGGGEGGGTPPPPPPVARLQVAPVDFGQVVLGESALRDLVVKNTTGTEFIHITAFTAPQNGITIDGAVPILPLTIGPGRELRIQLRFEPAQVGAVAQTIDFLDGQKTLAGGAVAGEGVSSEIVRDFGSVRVDRITGQTADLAVDVPAEAVSLTIEAEGTVNDFIVPVLLEGPGGQVYVDPRDPWAGPYVFERNFPAAALPGRNPVRYAPFEVARFQVPNSDDPRVQLVRGGGRYRFRLAVPQGTSTQLQVRTVVERRSRPDQGHIDLNVFLAPGLGFGAGDARALDMIDEAEAILRQSGLGFGEISFFDLPDTFDNVSTRGQLDALFLESARAPAGRVHAFVVVSLGGFLGLAGAQPGGKEKGTPYSGVAVTYYAQAGLNLAHEIGHYLGLAHTVEPDRTFPWTHDIILDTVECPIDGSPDLSCPVFGADLLMHPGPVADPAITPGQAGVMLRHILVEPGPGR